MISIQKIKLAIFLFLLIGTLLFAYQNCGVQQGGSIYSSCLVGGNCGGGNINLLSVRPDIPNNQYTVAISNSFGGTPAFNNISISGSCNNGGFLRTIVRATIRGGVSPISFTSYCGQDNRFNISGYAALSAGYSYRLDIAISALNEYLQEVYGPNSYVAPINILTIEAKPPVLSLLMNCNNKTALNCLQGVNAGNPWNLPSDTSAVADAITHSAVIISNASGSLLIPTTITGFCNTGSDVTVMLIPYGYSYSNFSNTSPPITKTTACESKTSAIGASDYNGYFQVNNLSVPLATGSSVVPCQNNSECLSNPFNKSNARLYQVVVSQNLVVNQGVQHIASSRNAFFKYQDPSNGNNWDTNILQETLKRIAKAFYFSPGYPSTSSLYSNFALAAQKIVASRTQGNYQCTSSSTTYSYYYGTRSWILDFIGASESLDNPACTNATPNIKLNLNTNPFTNMKNASTCGINSSVTHITGSFNAPNEGARRIAACLTSRYVMGFGQPSSSSNLNAYADKFTNIGIKCTDQACSACQFQDNSAVQSSNGIMSDCKIMANFYTQAVTYQNSPNKLMQFYINFVLGNNSLSNSTVQDAIFKTVYPNITDTNVISSMRPLEKNYDGSNTHLGAMPNNNFPQQ